MGRAAALVFAREGALVVGCDLSVGAAQATVELVRGAGGEMVSKQLRHPTEPADCQALVDLALGSSAGSTRCSTSPRRGRRLPAA
jgi:NAD(P)-dependent dehydrogenase (short-subunit alcohol dehydrogenase family)